MQEASACSNVILVFIKSFGQKSQLALNTPQRQALSYLTQWVVAWDPETSYCMAHMPYLYLDVHKACVMYKMRTYISLVEGLRDRRRAYTREVRKLGVTLRQLFIIMSEKCHGDLMFTIYDCAALER